MVILFLERKNHFINVKIFFPYTYIYHGEVVTRKMDIGTDMMLRTGLYDTRMSLFYAADFPSLFVGLGEYRCCYISPLSFSVPGGGCHSLGCYGYLQALLEAHISLGTTTHFHTSTLPKLIYWQ